MESGIESTSGKSPALANGFFTTSATWEACKGHQPANNVLGQVMEKELKNGRIVENRVSSSHFKFNEHILFFFLLFGL